MTKTVKTVLSTDSVIRRVGQDSSYAAKLIGTKQGEDLVKSHAYNIWDEMKGAERRAMEMRADHAREEFERLKEEKKNLRKERKQTAMNLQVPKVRRMGIEKASRSKADDTDDFDEVDWSFWDWNTLDQITVVSFIMIALLLLLLGAANIVGIALGSGVEAIVRMPALAYLLGALVPAAAMALKSGIHLFDGDWPRKIYTWAIYSVSLVLMISWIVLFAMNFEGLNAGIDWNNLGQASDHSAAKALTIVQILAEIFVGAALFLVVHQIWASYSANYVIRNPRFQAIDKDFRLVMKEFEAAQEAHITADSQLTQLLAGREAFAETSLADWYALSNQ